jgi:integrase
MTPAVIQDFITARLASGVSKATANRDRSMLHGIFNFAIRRSAFGGSNPGHSLKPFPESLGRLRFLSSDEVEQLLSKSAQHLKPIIICALHTGARHSEVLSLRWQDVDLAHGVIHFNRESTKSGKGRQVPIAPLLAAALRKRKMSRLRGGESRDYVFVWRGRRLRTVRTAFKKAREDAGLGREVGFHTLRHTFASWFVMNGGDLYRLQKYLGHSTIVLTQRYAHLSSEYLKNGVEFIGAPKPAENRSHTVDTDDHLS